MDQADGIARNVAAVQERIAAAARRARRRPEEVTLVAVTKTHPPEIIAAAATAGLVDFGENRIQEAAEKIPLLRDRAGLRWHLIGHLQRNKARKAVELFDIVHSVDSLRLAETLDRLVREERLRLLRRLPILLQVNIAGEQQKAGFDLPGGLQNDSVLGRFYPEIEQILSLSGLEVRGLMTIGPIVSDTEEIRPTFRALRELRDDLARRFPEAGWHELSMGMTGDFEVAVEEGATLVRVGRAIFGERG
jgi:pyridoxal phosphate enzyme (YggS family)